MTKNGQKQCFLMAKRTFSSKSLQLDKKSLKNHQKLTNKLVIKNDVKFDYQKGG